MVRRAAKVDANQREIISALRDIGCSVTPLHAVGGGVPDLLVGLCLVTVLMEVKNRDGRAARSQVLTPEQEAWHNAWQGRPAEIVYTADEAVELMWKA